MRRIDFLEIPCASDHLGIHFRSFGIGEKHEQMRAVGVVGFDQFFDFRRRGGRDPNAALETPTTGLGKRAIQLASLRALQFRNVEKEEPPFSIPGSCPGFLRIAAIKHDGATGFREPVKAFS